ncbi:MAG: class I SAM-dependent methyltransferase [Acholeplasmataceae bacterium]|nr:class I SAM-dependent methyltransferase [Acholeplasmataceae bacterium]
MKKNLILDYAHTLLKANISKIDIVVDATMGNGFDTIFLSSLCNKVYTFDIQEKAIEETSRKIKELKINHVELIFDSHENINNHVLNYKAVIFNLGYLPNGDKSITTHALSTISSISSILPKLPVGGFIQLVIYTGHDEGKKESIAIQSYLNHLETDTYKVVKIELPFQDNYPPYILMIHKVKDEN